MPNRYILTQHASVPFRGQEAMWFKQQGLSEMLVLKDFPYSIPALFIFKINMNYNPVVQSLYLIRTLITAIMESFGSALYTVCLKDDEQYQNAEHDTSEDEN